MKSEKNATEQIELKYFANQSGKFGDKIAFDFECFSLKDLSSKFFDSSKRPWWEFLSFWTPPAISPDEGLHNK